MPGGERGSLLTRGNACGRPRPCRHRSRVVGLFSVDLQRARIQQHIVQRRVIEPRRRRQPNRAAGAAPVAGDTLLRHPFDRDAGISAGGRHAGVAAGRGPPASVNGRIFGIWCFGIGRTPAHHLALAVALHLKHPPVASPTPVTVRCPIVIPPASSFLTVPVRVRPGYNSVSYRDPAFHPLCRLSRSDGRCPGADPGTGTGRDRMPRRIRTALARALNLYG